MRPFLLALTLFLSSLCTTRCSCRFSSMWKFLTASLMHLIVLEID
jgi:hypothetical protein